MSRQAEWHKGKRAAGMRAIRPLITTEAAEALDRLKKTRGTTQAVVNAAIIQLDKQDRANERLN